MDHHNVFDDMPLELMMLVEVRSGALGKYRELDDKTRSRLERESRTLGRLEKERLIDSLERGDFS